MFSRKILDMVYSTHCRSLRHNIKAEKPVKTEDGGGVESTVRVDVEDREVDGHPIKIFDCAGQVRNPLFLSRVFSVALSVAQSERQRDVLEFVLFI